MPATLIPELQSDGLVLAEVRGTLGLITLNRPSALNALSLAMIRDLSAVLHAWATQPAVQSVVVLGAGREGRAPAFCAGGDIRFFHQAVLAADMSFEDFFTEEYALNHLIHNFPKPYIALMDGVVMGGGMGITQGAALRVVTEHSKLAMPETQIGLFPDVGGGFFLSQCAGHVGEWLALTGYVLGAADGIELGLADVFVPSAELAKLVELLRQDKPADAEHVVALVMDRAERAPETLAHDWQERIDRHFGHASVGAIMTSLLSDPDEWAQQTHATLLKKSPLMLAVTLEQLRRARGQSLAGVLRMERDIVHHCFHQRPGPASETMEGIRALVIDKDHAPRWNPARIDEVTPALVQAFFVSPWPAQAHPLRHLS